MSPADRLRQAREAKGYESAKAAAEAMQGVAVTTYQQHESGLRGFPAAKAAKYGKFFGVPAEWLLYGKGDAPVSDVAPPAVGQPLISTSPGDPVSLAAIRENIAAFSAMPRVAGGGRLRNIERRIPVVGAVAAGAWRETFAVQLSDIDEYLPIDVPGYERAQLTALKVVGPSMNLVYPEGRYVVVAPPAEAGVRIGDYVVVERHRAGFVEITLKEFVVDEKGRMALWPRSSDPDFQEPFYLKPMDDLDQTAPMIVGVVVADYNKRQRPPAIFERI